MSGTGRRTVQDSRVWQGGFATADGYVVVEEQVGPACAVPNRPPFEAGGQLDSSTNGSKVVFSSMTMFKRRLTWWTSNGRRLEHLRDAGGRREAGQFLAQERDAVTEVRTQGDDRTTTRITGVADWRHHRTFEC